MSYSDCASISRHTLLQIVEAYPVSKRVLRRAAIFLAMRRHVINVAREARTQRLSQIGRDGGGFGGGLSETSTGEKSCNSMLARGMSGGGMRAKAPSRQGTFSMRDLMGLDGLKGDFMERISAATAKLLDEKQQESVNIALAMADAQNKIDAREESTSAQGEALLARFVALDPGVVMPDRRFQAGGGAQAGGGQEAVLAVLRGMQEDMRELKGAVRELKRGRGAGGGGGGSAGGGGGGGGGGGSSLHRRPGAMSMQIESPPSKDDEDDEVELVAGVAPPAPAASGPLMTPTLDLGQAPLQREVVVPSAKLHTGPDEEDKAAEGRAARGRVATRRTRRSASRELDLDHGGTRRSASRELDLDQGGASSRGGRSGCDGWL